MIVSVEVPTNLALFLIKIIPEDGWVLWGGGGGGGREGEREMGMEVEALVSAVESLQPFL